MQKNGKWIKLIQFNKNNYLNFFKNEFLSIFNSNKNSPYKYIFIIGENGIGKTLFLNSLQWCLYGTYYEKNKRIYITHSIPCIDLKITLNDGQIIGYNDSKLQTKFYLFFGKFEQFELDGGGSQLLNFLSKSINIDIDSAATQYIGFSNTSYYCPVLEIVDNDKKDTIIENWKKLGLGFDDFGYKIVGENKYICLNGWTKNDHELELKKLSSDHGKKYEEIYNSFSDGETSIFNFSMIDFKSEIYHWFHDEFGLFLNSYQKTRMIDYLYTKSTDNNTQYFISSNSLTITASVIEHMIMEERNDTLLLLFSKNNSQYVNVYRYAYDIKSKSIINLDNNENIFLLKPISINEISYKLFKIPNYIYFLELINTIKDNDKYKKIKGNKQDYETLIDLIGKEKILESINHFEYLKNSIFIKSPEKLILQYRNVIAHNKWHTQENINDFMFKYNDTVFLKEMIRLLEEVFNKINNK